VNEADLAYFRERERRERTAASSATLPEAQRVHEELANQYSALAQGDSGSRDMPTRSRQRLSIVS
jgi:hypothetical protein